MGTVSPRSPRAGCAGSVGVGAGGADVTDCCTLGADPVVFGDGAELTALVGASDSSMAVATPPVSPPTKRNTVNPMPARTTTAATTATTMRAVVRRWLLC